MVVSPIATRAGSGDRLTQWIEPAIAVIAMSITGYILVTTLVVVWNAYTPIPLFDSWDHWRLFVRDGRYSAFLFAQHNEHRIAVPRLFFMVDHFMFLARSEFVLLCIQLLQLVSGILLLRLVKRNGVCGPITYWVAAAIVFSAVFSSQQFTNLTWSFQIQFGLVCCAAVAAVYATIRAAEAIERGLRPEGWLTASCVFAIAATYSMANGLLIWPVLAALALWLRLPSRYALMFGIDAILTGWFYTRGLTTPPGQLSPFYVLLHHFPAAFIFSAQYIGAPATALTHLLPARWFRPTDISLLGVAGIFGVSGMAFTLYLWVASWLRRGKFGGGQAGLIHISLFILLTAASVGIGRSTLLGASDPLTSRYKTPALIFWGALLAQSWVKLDQLSVQRALPWKFAQGVGVLTVLSALALEQPVWIKYSKLYADVVGHAQAAVVADVFDEAEWKTLYHTPANMFEAVTYLRQNNLSIFSEDWTHWAGQPVKQLFALGDAHACVGSFDEAVPIASALKPGWRVSGWGWDKRHATGPGLIVFVNKDGIIKGTADQVNERPDVSRSFPYMGKGARVGWTGYVAGNQAETLTAYLLPEGSNSLCALGKLKTGSVKTDSDTRPSQGGGSCEAEKLVDFHEPEDWGAWSAADPSRLIFRHSIKGHFRVVFTAYGLADGRPHQLHLTIGNETRVIALTPKPTTVELDYQLREAAGEAVFSGISPASPRSLGIGMDDRVVAVGLVKLDCEMVTP